MEERNMEPVVSSRIVKATKQWGTIITINPAMINDCGCVADVGCCKDKGCCGEGKCPAEMSTSWGCLGDNFQINIRAHEDLIKDYILENKQSVVKYFKSKGVDLEQ
jgi:hypothetical protein